ncbi:MAG TPA: hypothetical protein ENF27_05185 [Chloroflexi bacterium]|nr:hypothetical protein [Chloroflexota bacterium]
MTNNNTIIPTGLKTWFVIHFVADMLFAIPLIFFPEVIMPWFGWGAIDPVMPRLVGAALLGIGGESLFSRNASRDAFKSLLRLKIIWASGAILALGLGIVKGAPPAAWGFLAMFVGFLGIWVFYRIKLTDPV